MIIVLYLNYGYHIFYKCCIHLYENGEIDIVFNRLKYDFFSWDEMAQYDLPAMINKAIETTNEPRIFYIGHSMGTTALMAMPTFHPEMNDKIILASLLAPVAFVEHMRSPIALISPFANIIEVTLKKY